MELNTNDCYIAGKISGLSEEEYTSNFLKAKEDSRGAKVEVTLAKDLGISVIYQK